MSMDAVIRIEQEFGTTILKIGKMLQEHDITVMHCVKFLTIAIRSGGNDIDENKIKEIINAQPYLETIKMIGELISLALDVDDDGEKKNQLHQAN
tara:strand:- start:6780 stop:7064 length:285 start_codon:yes stop_codon:yes gene_type:complete